MGERRQPDGTLSYDFSWLNGPPGGTYGFTVAPSSGQMTATALVMQARQFVDAFSGPGGIGETDFPDHLPAEAERST